MKESVRALSEAATRTIPGLDGYEVDDEGRVWSLSNWRGYGRRTLTPVLNDGYLRVNLVIGDKRVHPQVHVLVCTAWHGIKAGPEWQVRHLDGDKLNNRPSNLAWGTAKDNADDREAHGHTAIGERNGFARLRNDQVRRIRASKGVFSQRQLAAQYGVSQRVIGRVVRGEQWAHVE